VHPAGDANDEIADEDLVGGAERGGFGDLAAVHIGPIGAAHVFDHELAALKQQATVVL
jgi:hypothetical protein